MRRASLGVVLVLLVGCTGLTASPDPLAGQIRFGDSFDSQTLALTGERTTVRVGQTTVYVAHLKRAVTESSVNVTFGVNGFDFGPSALAVTSPPWTVYGATIPGSLFHETGPAFVIITDVGNNELARGTLTVVP